MSSSTSAADRLAQCVEFLRSLTPEGLDSDETYAPLVETGCALFKSQVLKRAFGQEDVLSYMREQLEQKRLLKKLEKLAQRINEVHEGRLRKAKFAGINTQRQESWMSIQAGEMPTALMEAPPVGLLGSVTGTPAAPPDFSQDAEATKQVLDASSALGATAQPPVGSATATVSGDDTEIDMDAVRRAASLHPGSFSQSCNSCGHGFEERHRFYHQLCVGCAELNWTKRLASPDMRGKVAVVTGGRVRIGFHIVLKLLRAGATVLTTTRYPVDAAARYSREPDFDEWRSRLEVVSASQPCRRSLRAVPNHPTRPILLAVLKSVLYPECVGWASRPVRPGNGGALLRRPSRAVRSDRCAGQQCCTDAHARPRLVRQDGSDRGASEMPLLAEELKWCPRRFQHRWLPSGGAVSSRSPTARNDVHVGLV